MGRVERPRGKSAREPPRLEIDPSWLRRGLLVLAVLGFIAVLTKASMMLFSTAGKRVERHERATEQPAGTPPASAPKPAAQR